jgi:hypothetical protein
MTSTIEITEVRNARSMNAENTMIDVEINHPDYGWIPYLLTDFDTDNTIDNDNLMSLIGSDFSPYVAPTQEELDATSASQVRYVRDGRLVSEVDPVVSNPLRWADLSEQEQADVSAYRLALLDVPSQSGFPHTVSWPTKPSCL